jgi:hypothetical protein
MRSSPHAVHLVHAGCCYTRAPARTSMLSPGRGGSAGMVLRPARAPSAPGSVDAFPSYGLRGGASRCSVWLARHPAMHPARRRRGWAWGRVSMFTISGYSCTTYRAAFSSYTYLTERIEYEFSVTSLAMKVISVQTSNGRRQFTVINVQPRARQISPLARGGAPAGAGRMVVERINKTELRTAVCGELEGQERGGADAPRLRSRI